VERQMQLRKRLFKYKKEKQLIFTTISKIEKCQ
jgi:hypothetical protein